MSNEDLERIKYQRDSLKRIIEKMYFSSIEKAHRWNCLLRLNMECNCETAIAMSEYEEFLWQEEIYQKENNITNGMDTKRC